MSTRKRKRSSTPSPTPSPNPPKKLTGYERFCQRKRQRTENQGWQGRSLDYKETLSKNYQTNPDGNDLNLFYELHGTTALVYFLYTVHPNSRKKYQNHLRDPHNNHKPHMDANKDEVWVEMLKAFEKCPPEDKKNYINQRIWDKKSESYDKHWEEGASKTGEGASKTGEGASKTGEGKKRKRIKSRKIKINPKMRGVFTRKAKRAKMTVKQYANHIIKKYKDKKKTK